VSETQRQAVDFYRSVVQTLRPWRAPVPTLPPQDHDAVEAAEGPATSKLDTSTAGEALARNTSISSSGVDDPN